MASVGRLLYVIYAKRKKDLGVVLLLSIGVLLTTTFIAFRLW